MQASDAPSFDVTINGTALAEDLRSYLTRISVDDSLGQPSMFLLEFGNSNLREGKPMHDLDLFQIGHEVDVTLGQRGDLARVIVGEITGLEPSYAADNLPTLAVRGYDLRHRLQRGRKVRSFVQQTDSEIVRKIIREANVSARHVQDSPLTHEHLLQSGQTDLEFLLERAARIGFDIKMQGKDLLFGPVAADASPALTLSLADTLLEFHPRLSAVGQVSKVRVQGWDPKQKAAVSAEARQPGHAMGGGVDGPTLAKQAFGEAVGLWADGSLTPKHEPGRLTQALLDASALALVTGEGVCIGCPTLQAGVVVALEGLGQRFSGAYYVTEASHVYDTAAGYTTRFSVRRNTL